MLNEVPDSSCMLGYHKGWSASNKFLTWSHRQFRNETLDSLPPPYQLHDEDSLVSEYLAALLNHLMWTMGQNLGISLGKAELEFCLTIPSDWNDTSKEKYVRDFQKSLDIVGLRVNAPVSLVTESVSLLG
jgi:hypothetical protein